MHKKITSKLLRENNPNFRNIFRYFKITLTWQADWEHSINSKKLKRTFFFMLVVIIKYTIKFKSENLQIFFFLHTDFDLWKKVQFWHKSGILLEDKCSWIKAIFIEEAERFYLVLIVIETKKKRRIYKIYGLQVKSPSGLSLTKLMWKGPWLTRQTLSNISKQMKWSILIELTNQYEVFW